MKNRFIEHPDGSFTQAQVTQQNFDDFDNECDRKFDEQEVAPWERVGVKVSLSNGETITYWCRQDMLESVKYWAHERHNGCEFLVVPE